MSSFDPDQFLLDLQQSDLPDEAKEKCETLRENIRYVAPQLLGDYFFNGFKSTTGICEILGTYTPNQDTDLDKTMKNKFAEVCKQYAEWLDSKNL